MKQRVVYYDLLNIVACIAVVFLHSNVMVFSYSSGKNWAMGLGIEVLFYWAVPIFLMLSGANLMGYRKRYDTRTFFKKRVAKTFIPFVIWSILFYLLRFGVEHGANQNFGLKQFFELFFTNGIEPVYWFFFPLFALYLAMPALAILADHRRTLVYLAATAFALQSVVLPFCSMFHLPWNPSVEQPMVTTFVLFAILGYLCSTHVFTAKERAVIYFLGVGSLIFRYLYTFIMSQQSGMFVTTLSDYGYFIGVLPSVALFVFFKTVKWPKLVQTNTNILTKISSCSFGVYLIHELFLREIIFGLLEVSPHSLALRTAAPIAIWAICVLFVMIIKKIPCLKIIVP